MEFKINFIQKVWIQLRGWVYKRFYHLPKGYIPNPENELIVKSVGQPSQRTPPIQAAYQLYKLARQLNPKSIENPRTRVRRIVGAAR